MNRNQNRKGRTPSGVLTIVRKELHRFFGDRRMLMTVLLPGIIIYVVYSLMGSTMMSSLMGDTETPYTMQAENLPASIEAGLEAVGEASGTTVETVTEESDPKAAVADGKLDIYVVFPTDFDELVAEYDPASGLPAPAVEIYYNSSEPRSQNAYALVASVLDAYESALANRMDINPDPSVAYDLAAPEDITEMLFSMLMPMLLLVLMFSGCMAMTTESIAGEKERGTIATLLVTPVRRWELALGKIAALSIISLLAGLCSFAGVILALPKLMGGEEMGMADASIYTLGDYGMILCVILSTVLLFVSLIAVLSALANSVKEAASLVTPLMLLITVVGVSGMFSEDASVSLGFFFIPVYNTVQCISGVFSMSYEPIGILITVLVNVLTAGLFALLLSYLFCSEKVMFKK